MADSDTGLLIKRIAKDHYRTLKDYLVRKLRSSDDAEDVTQESFLRLQNVKNLRDIENPRAYLFKTANNLIIERSRKAASAQTVSLDAASELNMFDAEDVSANPEKVEGAREELELVTAAIMGLPERCRKAFILKKFYHLSLKEIARTMGISEKTVEKHITKGLLACHTHLNRMHKGKVLRFSSTRSKDH